MHVENGISQAEGRHHCLHRSCPNVFIGVHSNDDMVSGLQSRLDELLQVFIKYLDGAVVSALIVPVALLAEIWGARVVFAFIWAVGRYHCCGIAVPALDSHPRPASQSGVVHFFLNHPWLSLIECHCKCSSRLFALGIVDVMLVVGEQKVLAWQFASSPFNPGIFGVDVWGIPVGFCSQEDICLVMSELVNEVEAFEVSFVHRQASYVAQHESGVVVRFVFDEVSAIMVVQAMVGVVDAEMSCQFRDDGIVGWVILNGVP